MSDDARFNNAARSKFLPRLSLVWLLVLVFAIFTHSWVAVVILGMIAFSVAWVRFTRPNYQPISRRKRRRLVRR